MFEEYINKKIAIKNTKDKGRGYFATQNIKKGELIMKSHAICLTVFTNNYEQDYKTLLTQEAENLPQFTQQAQELYKSLFTGQEQVTEQNSLMLKFNFNSYRCQPRLDAPYDYKKSLKNPEAGLFPLASIFNHSCVPNCTKYFQGKYMIIIANKDIKIDEELYLGYLENEQNYFNFYGRKKCLSNYFNNCNCLLCQFQQTDQYKQLQKRLDYFLLLIQKQSDVILDDVQKFINLVTEVQKLVEQNTLVALDGEQEVADYILIKNGNKYQQIQISTQNQNDQSITYDLELYSKHLCLQQDQARSNMLLIDLLIDIACYGFSLQRPIPLRPETAFVVQKLKYLKMFHKNESAQLKEDFIQKDLILYDTQRFRQTEHIELRYKHQFKKWK